MSDAPEAEGARLQKSDDGRSAGGGFRSFSIPTAGDVVKQAGQMQSWQHPQSAIGCREIQAASNPLLER